jgi:hypothetical protein
MLDGLTMKPHALDPGSALSAETRFRFAQRGALVTGEYVGGPVFRGFLAGRLDGGALEFRYVQLSHDGRVDAGHSCCEVVSTDTGLRLVERFAWETRAGVGTNIFVQCD